MKENEDKHIERLLDSVMKEVPLETPSFDFTARVMAQVAVTERTTTIAYKPLLSKWFWYALFFAVALVIGYAAFDTDMQTGHGYGVDFKKLYDAKIPSFSFGIKFSKIAMYAVLVMVLMLFVKISMLKNHYDKQLKL